MRNVLLLNSDYTPIKVIPWETAIKMILDQKVYSITDYADKVIRTVTQEFAFPAVVVLKTFHKVGLVSRFNRANLLNRDGYQCQYCGAKPVTRHGHPDLEVLTLDHVVPRAKSKKGMVVLPWSGQTVPVTCWENIVAACVRCNSHKRDRLPEEAGFKLRRLPYRPSPWDALRMTLTRHPIPDEWKDYLPTDSPWRDYWDGELDAS